jgi:hypothetical protein
MIRHIQAVVIASALLVGVSASNPALSQQPGEHVDPRGGDDLGCVADDGGCSTIWSSTTRT